LYDDQRVILDSAASGRFQRNVEDNKGWEIIEEMANHTSEYGNPRGGTRTTAAISNNSAIVSQLEALNARFDKIEGLGKGNQQTVHLLSRQETVSCERCGENGHPATECMAEKEQVFAFQQYRANYSNIHPNLRWSSQNVLNPTPPPQQQPYVPPHKAQQGFPRPPYQAQHNNAASSSSNNDMAELKSMFHTLVLQMVARDASFKLLESQVAQLASKQSTRAPG